MIMDTGSGNTWALHRFCENCNKKSEKLDERNSSTFSFYPAMYDFHYGIGSTYGYNAFDQLCLSKNQSCTKDFSFFLIGYQKDVSSLTVGLVGLSPYWTKASRQDNFILKLKQSGIIDQSVFSFRVDLDNNDTRMTFGGYDLQKYAMKGFPLNWHSINQKAPSWWTLHLNNLSLKRNKNTTHGHLAEIDYYDK